MEMARKAGNKDAAQVVAAECLVLTETKDHLNWELIGAAAKASKGDQAKALKAAHDEVEETPRAMTSRSIFANQISTWFSQEELVA